MWANTCWGLAGFALAFGLAVPSLPTEYGWLAPYFVRSSIACAIASAVCFGWPMRKQDNRAWLSNHVKATLHRLAWLWAKIVEPWHVIVLGLAIAVAGLIWLWLKPPAATEVAALREQVAALREQLARPKVVTGAPAPPAFLAPMQGGAVPRPPQPDIQAPPDPVIRHYSPTERNTILDTLGELQAFLDARRGTNPAVRRALPRREGMGGFIYPRNSDAADIAVALEAVPPELEKDRQALKEMLGKARFFDQILYPTVNEGEIDHIYSAYRGSLIEVMGLLKTAAKVPNDIPFLPYAEKTFDQLRSANQAYSDWIRQSTERIKATTKEVREWQ